MTFNEILSQTIDMLKQHGRLESARDDLSRALDIFECLGTLGQPDKVRHAFSGAFRKRMYRDGTGFLFRGKTERQAHSNAM